MLLTDDVEQIETDEIHLGDVFYHIDQKSLHILENSDRHDRIEVLMNVLMMVVGFENNDDPKNEGDFGNYRDTMEDSVHMND